MATNLFLVTDGQRTSAAASSSPMLAPKAGQVGLLREHEEARSQIEALILANQRMEAFLGIAMHELRSPITSSALGVHLTATRVDMVLDHVKLREHDAELTNHLTAVQDLLADADIGLERLTRLINDLLDVSFLQTGHLPQHQARHDLRAIVRSAVEEQRQLAPLRRIRLRLPARKAIPIWADADRLHQIVTNYLTNALKYSPLELPIDVGVAVRRDCVRVSVSDQGPGIPIEEQARVWEMFHRAPGAAAPSRTRSGTTQSLGLGLYICKLIIEQHHGQVGVRSTPGQGATFWFELPVMPAFSSQGEEPRPCAGDVASDVEASA